MKALLFGLIGSLSDWLLRGGGVESALFAKKNPDGSYNFPNIPGLREANALLYGGLGWYQSGSVVVAALLSTGMYLGSIQGLEQFMYAMLGINTTHTKAWGILHLSLRGAIMGFCIGDSAALGHLVMGMSVPWIFIVATISAGILQGPIRYAVVRLFNGRAGNRVFNYWTVGEIVQGFPLWMTLALLAKKIWQVHPFFGIGL